MAGERKDDRRRRKFLLIGFVGVAMMAVLGFGTFATFNAQVGNPSNTFASGTIVLNDTVPGGVPCLSTGGGTTDVNVNAKCDTLIKVTVASPGDAAFSDLTIKNEGSLDANLFNVFSNA